ncbi:3-oxoacyl-[acyl-carrier-protein] synthase III C-terminal domain-containing protein [Telmatospirillum siberiense]|nr:3-oxoacyl-[acyl-carrier-protein] synthase III C-terminal domain-containing protein [Telmatospirillum siberiense]
MSVTTLERIESHLPARSIRIDDLAERLSLRPTEIGVFRKIYGLDRLHFDTDLDFFDLLLPAARRALLHLPTDGFVAYVIYAHTVQTVAPPDIDPAQVIKRELGIEGAEAFALNQQACVSSLGAIDLAGTLLRSEAPKGAYALIVTGEQAFSPKIQLIPHSAIMAEGAAACLVTLDGGGDRVRSFVTRTLGQFSAGLLMTNEEIRELGALYAKTLALVISEAIAEAGLRPDDIHLIIPHNVNTITWKQTIKELEIGIDKFFLENIPKVSHCYSSDVFINYTTLLEEKRLVGNGNYVLASVGLGATFGALVVTRKESN